MINTKIAAALNEQLNMEYYSAYSYLAMSAYFLTQNLNGFAHWMRVQAQEELTHGMKIYDFLDDREADIRFSAIETPKQSWDSPLEVFEDSLAQEQKVSQSIYNIADLALSERGPRHPYLSPVVYCRTSRRRSRCQGIDRHDQAGRHRGQWLILARPRPRAATTQRHGYCRGPVASL